MANNQAATLQSRACYRSWCFNALIEIQVTPTAKGITGNALIEIQVTPTAKGITGTGNTNSRFPASSCSWSLKDCALLSQEKLSIPVCFCQTRNMTPASFQVLPPVVDNTLLLIHWCWWAKHASGEHQVAPVGPTLQAAPGPSPLAAVHVQWLNMMASLASRTQLGTMKPTRTAPSPSRGLAQ